MQILVMPSICTVCNSSFSLEFWVFVFLSISHTGLVFNYELQCYFFGIDINTWSFTSICIIPHLVLFMSSPQTNCCGNRILEYTIYTKALCNRALCLFHYLPKTEVESFEYLKYAQDTEALHFPCSMGKQVFDFCGVFCFLFFFL